MTGVVVREVVPVEVMVEVIVVVGEVVGENVAVEVRVVVGVVMEHSSKVPSLYESIASFKMLAATRHDLPVSPLTYPPNAQTVSSFEVTSPLLFSKMILSKSSAWWVWVGKCVVWWQVEFIRPHERGVNVSNRVKVGNNPQRERDTYTATTASRVSSPHMYYFHPEFGEVKRSKPEGRLATNSHARSFEFSALINCFPDTSAQPNGPSLPVQAV
jgi:hypothetical protein